MSTLKSLSLKFIAISALGFAMTAPVIAAPQSTVNTPTTSVTAAPSSTTEIDGVQVPTTQVMAATDAQKATNTTAEQAADSAASEAAEAEAADSAK